MIKNTTRTLKDNVGIWTLRNIFKMAMFVSRPHKVVFPESKNEFSYGGHPDERLDFIAPLKTIKERVPIVYFHGGGWIIGKKEIVNKQLAVLAEAGHPVFNIEYPLAPENSHPKLLLSALKAIAFIKEKYPQYKEVHLIGDSAGGNIAMMLGILVCNPSLKTILGDDVDINSPKIKSIASLYGVMDRLSWLEAGFPASTLFMHNYAGKNVCKKEVCHQDSITPMDLTFEKLPPVFLAVGSKDKLLNSSKIFAQRLEQESKTVSYKVYPGASHGFISFGTGSKELLMDIKTFFS